MDLHSGVCNLCSILSVSKHTLMGMCSGIHLGWQLMSDEFRDTSPIEFVFPELSVRHATSYRVQVM